MPGYMTAQVCAGSRPAILAAERSSRDRRPSRETPAILHIHDGSSIGTAMKTRTPTMRLVRRRCLVCDAEREVVEPIDSDEIGSPCSSCGAPSERTAVLRDRLVPKNPNAVALGRLGGLKGGPARAQALTSQRRREIARRAILARWKRAKG